MQILRDWFNQHFSNPQVVILALVLLSGLLVFLLLGQILGPMIAAVVIAYVLDAPAEALRRRGMPHRAAVLLVFLVFLSVIAVSLLAIFPLVSQQLTQLVVLLPSMAGRAQELLLMLPEYYPELIGRDQVLELTGRLQSDVLVLGQNLLLLSVDQIGGLITVVLYLFLVPFMVFFFLKDKARIQAWLTRVLPSERPLVNAVWTEVDLKTGAYVRGKIYEVGVIGGVSFVVFTILGLDLAALLATLSGLSVLVPYVGVAVVSVPVALVGFFQFGFSGELGLAIGAYAAIQVIDGNLLAPLLISEVVDLHPIAVIGSILVFGSLWGFWGVFFAIPLATLAIAVVNAWPEVEQAASGNPS